MSNHISLFDEIFIPKQNREDNSIEKYEYLRNLYNSGAHYVLINNISVFKPFPCANVPWDISEAQKIAIYNPEVTKVLNWINTKILINLSIMNYKTLDVLIRIATGMLNKCDISKEYKILFHDNMVKNLQTEYGNLLISDLPF